MHILLVEDNLSIIKGLEYSLINNNYDFNYTTTIKETKEYLSKNKVDLIILDITFISSFPFTCIFEIIKDKKIPTIFLTAQDEEEYIVKGLEIGGEDYLTKPFRTKELLVRINKILKRNQTTNIKKVKDISFDMDKMIVFKENKPINLTSLELKLLHLLFLNINKVVSRNTILDKIWEWTGNDVDDHTVTVYFKRIREKIKSDIIITIKGIGYRIDV